MRRRAALGAWIDDRDAQARSRAGAMAVARVCHALPALATFRRAVAAAGDGPVGAGRVDAAAADLLANPGWCAALIGILVEALTADPFFVPPQLPIDSALHRGLLIHDDARVAVALGIGALEPLAAHKQARAGPASIVFSGYRTRLRFLKASGATLAFYRLDHGRATFTGRRRIADGDALAVDGRDTSWVVEHAAGDLLILQASIKGDCAPLTVECDATTGRAHGHSTTDEAASRMQMLLSLLGVMERDDAAPAIAACLSDRHGFVRWHAMRELTALDPDAALPRLVAMAAGDPDGEVRDAARATLALLEAAPACPA